jgi:hypothetical protein
MIVGEIAKHDELRGPPASFEAKIAAAAPKKHAALHFLCSTFQFLNRLVNSPT